MTKRVAVLGISGVGKSTAISALKNRLNFQHVQASALIKAACDNAQPGSFELDDLRSADIDVNQAFLIAGFELAALAGPEMLILDGHSLIDTPAGFQEIHPDVFKGMKIKHMIFLAEKPEAIVARRDADQTRSRPGRTVQFVDNYQRSALLAAFNIALALAIDLRVIVSNHEAELCDSLQAFR